MPRPCHGFDSRYPLQNPATRQKPGLQKSTPALEVGRGSVAWPIAGHKSFPEDLCLAISVESLRGPMGETGPSLGFDHFTKLEPILYFYN